MLLTTAGKGDAVNRAEQLLLSLTHPSLCGYHMLEKSEPIGRSHRREIGLAYVVLPETVCVDR